MPLKKKFVEAKKESSIDFLTGIPNRRFFDETLASMVRQSTSDLSMLLVDIDHFKDFNDRHGHLTGDNVLRFVARMIKKNVKGKDIVCRFGGRGVCGDPPGDAPGRRTFGGREHTAIFCEDTIASGFRGQGPRHAHRLHRSRVLPRR